MRKMIVTAMLAIISGIAMAQENKEAVPADVTEAFNMLYPNVKEVLWNFKETGFEANFQQDEKAISLLFDKSGNLMEVKKVIMESDLPADVRDMISKEYAGWRIWKAVRIDISGASNYEVEVEKDEQRMYLIFDKHGILLKEIGRQK